MWEILNDCPTTTTLQEIGIAINIQSYFGREQTRGSKVQGEASAVHLTLHLTTSISTRLPQQSVVMVSQHHIVVQQHGNDRRHTAAGWLSNTRREHDKRYLAPLASPPLRCNQFRCLKYRKKSHYSPSVQESKLFLESGRPRTCKRKNPRPLIS